MAEQKTIGAKFWRKDFGDEACLVGKSYTYLVPEGTQFQVGDVAVVETNGEPKCVTVVSLNPPLREGINYKWVVARVPHAQFVAARAQNEL